MVLATKIPKIVFPLCKILYHLLIVRMAYWRCNQYWSHN